MILVGLFAVFLFLIIVIGDWMQFSRLAPSAAKYGCRVAQSVDLMPVPLRALTMDRFSPDGLLSSPHGVARLYRDQQCILLRPHYRLFSLRVPTAWPMKASIALQEEGESTRLICVKLVPWSSAILTLIWFAIVGFGTIAFVIAYAMEGGMTSLGGIVMGVGIAGTGVLVFFFGLITVTVAYRLENDRLIHAYRELRGALEGSDITGQK